MSSFRKITSNFRFLVFRGSLQNEGNVWALESNETILLFGAGKDNPSVSKDIINLDYLIENKEKIKALFLCNFSPKNIGSLQFIYSELNKKIPIYGSKITKINLELYHNLNEKLLNNFIEVCNSTRDVSIDDFKVSFFILDSYLPGNIAISIYNEDRIFYYLEDFSFNVINNNNILFQDSFFQNIKSFFSLKKKKTYLIVGCQNLNWKNNGSIFSESEKLIIKNKKIFFITYDFDFLHIIEILEMFQKINKKVNILDEKMFFFLKRIIEENPSFLGEKNKLLETIVLNEKKGDFVNLLTLNIDSVNENIFHFFKNNSDSLFISCLFPISGAEERLARLSDYLHFQNSEFLDIGKSENSSIGTDFFDLKFILKILNPDEIITLQNSYKHIKILDKLESKKIKERIPNNKYFSSNTKKPSPIKVNKKFLNTDNLLFNQREKLLKNGLLVILLFADWIKKNENGKEIEEIQLLKLEIDSISVSSLIDFSKMKKKIEEWWKSKILPDSKFLFSDRNQKYNIEKRLSGLVKSYLFFANDSVFEDPLFLIFINNNLKKNIYAGR